MSVFIHQGAKVITQGVTGRVGRVYTELCMRYGEGETSFVAGVNPKKAGEVIFGMPIYATVKEAKEKTGATVSVIYVPAPTATAAIWEAVEADLDLVICTTEGIPVKDMLELFHKMRQKEDGGGKKTWLLGPGSPGVMIPEVVKIGVIPDFASSKGSVGVVTSSGALMYEVFAMLHQVGLAPSSLIGLGRGPLLGLKSKDVLQALMDDVCTQSVVLVAEGVGADLLEAGKWYQENGLRKPVAVYMAGFTKSFACSEEQNGLMSDDELLQAEEALCLCGFRVARTMSDLGVLLNAFA